MNSEKIFELIKQFGQKGYITESEKKILFLKAKTFGISERAIDILISAETRKKPTSSYEYENSVENFKSINRPVVEELREKPQSQYHQQTVVVMGKQKSVGTAFLLAFFFGPLGLLYASVTGGIVMFIIGVIIFIPTAGLGLILTWIGSIIWAIVAVNSDNEKLSSNNPGININTNFGNPSR